MIYFFLLFIWHEQNIRKRVYKLSTTGGTKGTFSTHHCLLEHMAELDGQQLSASNRNELQSHEPVKRIALLHEQKIHTRKFKQVDEQIHSVHTIHVGHLK